MPKEHIETLKAARRIHIEARRELAEKLAGPFAEGQTEAWRQSFLDVQAIIEAIDRAIGHEEGRTLRL